MFCLFQTDVPKICFIDKVWVFDLLKRQYSPLLNVPFLWKS